VKGFAFALGLATILDLVVVFLFRHPIMTMFANTKAFMSPRVSGLGRVLRRPPDRRAGEAAHLACEGGLTWPAKVLPIAIYRVRRPQYHRPSQDLVRGPRQSSSDPITSFFVGLHLGIEFEGGYAVHRAGQRGHPGRGAERGDRAVAAAECRRTPRSRTATKVGIGGEPRIPRDVRAHPGTGRHRTRRKLVKDLNVPGRERSDNECRAAWGTQVTQQALLGLGIFLVLVLGYLVVRFEWRMAVAAVSSLLLDLVLTAGVYSLVGFEVTPSTVIGFLTILGFSLY
jgi:hypothetical protein